MDFTCDQERSRTDEGRTAARVQSGNATDASLPLPAKTLRSAPRRNRHRSAPCSSLTLLGGAEIFSVAHLVSPPKVKSMALQARHHHSAPPRLTTRSLPAGTTPAKIQLTPGHHSFGQRCGSVSGQHELIKRKNNAAAYHKTHMQARLQTCPAQSSLQGRQSRSLRTRSCFWAQ